MPKAIVAIGGGEIRIGETTRIDREIIRLSRRKHPKLLFIPTASSDDEGYWEQVQKHFGGRLKCRMDVLWLIRKPASLRQIREKILSANVIYVGGGNTLLMMRLWRRLGIDKLLKEAYRKGIVLSGVSAGAICWFDAGHSDSISFTNPQNWKYIKVNALGLVPGLFCPHYNGATKRRARRADFKKMIGKIGGVGFGVENNCAIELVDHQFRIISSSRHARAYKLYKRRGQVVVEPIAEDQRLAPTRLLLEHPQSR